MEGATVGSGVDGAAGKKQRAKEDAELAAMKKIGFILDGMEVQAARRVLDYVMSKHLDRQVAAKRAEFNAGELKGPRGLMGRGEQGLPFDGPF